jgi:helicase
MVPRIQDIDSALPIVEAVRSEIGDLPLHVFGLGKPDIVRQLYRLGVDSVDSSAYVKLAAEGRLWSDPSFRLADPSPTDRLHLALCNLALATGRSWPLSAAGLVFSTRTLDAANSGALRA